MKWINSILCGLCFFLFACQKEEPAPTRFPESARVISGTYSVSIQFVYDSFPDEHFQLEGEAVFSRLNTRDLYAVVDSIGAFSIRSLGEGDEISLNKPSAGTDRFEGLFNAEGAYLSADSSLSFIGYGNYNKGGVYKVVFYGQKLR